MQRTHVLVVADDRLARAGLAHLLDAAVDEFTITQADSRLLLADGVSADGVSADVDVAVYDLGWDDGAALPDLRDVALPVVVLAADADSARAARAAGARGVLARDDAADARFVERLSAALLAAAAGLVVFDPALVDGPTVLAGEPALPPAEPLTNREIDVLTRLAAGDTNKAIAHHLGISDHTVKFHVNAVMTKLGAQSRTDAVVRALRLGVLSL